MAEDNIANTYGSQRLESYFKLETAKMRN